MELRTISSPCDARDLVGAYAGEIGQTQFLPSSYIKYGVEGKRLARWRAVRPRHGEFGGDARVELCRDLSPGASAVCGEGHGDTASALAV
jgi:hypothetical protein